MAAAETATRTRPQEVTIRYGASRTLTVAVGAVVLIRSGDHGSYSAVVSSIEKLHVRLTFTPEGEPRRAPMGLILAATPPSKRVEDLRGLPRFQPVPTVLPRRRPHQDT